MALVKYLPIFKMAAIVNLHRQMLTGVRLQAHAVSMKLAQTMIKIHWTKKAVSLNWKPCGNLPETSSSSFR